MPVKISSFANPFLSYCDSDYFSDENSPVPTGRWAMKGEAMYIEFKFTGNKLLFFEVEKFVLVHETDIEIEEEMKFFNCYEK